MKILALEFSSPQRSVAVLDQAGEPGAIQSQVIETGGPAARTIGMVEEALRQTRLEREQIECLAIGIGPGSYSGIRSTIALAQGWQLARPVKILGISSVQVLVEQAWEEGISGPVAVVIDAQRNEFYIADYEISAEARIEIKPLRLATLGDVRSCEQSGKLILGPEVGKWFGGGHTIFPRASTLARLALSRTDFKPGHEVEPIYLRETRFVKAPPPRVLPV